MASVVGLLGALGIIAAGWYVFSPRWVLATLSDPNRDPAQIAKLYDSKRLYDAFDRQTLPQVADYPPPLTKQVLLTALTDPRAVRALVIEPYGEWQFAAAEGVPPAFLLDGDQTGPTPRSLETSQDWTLNRDGLRGFVARGGDRAYDASHAYRFERDGLSWKLIAIELSEPIR